MPVHLRALVVILILATMVFAFAKAPACESASASGDFERRRNLWFGITLAAFLSHNFWIYIIIVAAMLFAASQREKNKLAMYYFILFAVPPIAQQVSGLGLIQHFFEINYFRLLALVILLPAFWTLRKRSDTVPFGKALPDKFILGYLLLQFALTLNFSTFTDTLRVRAFYALIDVLLPYYVASRSMKTPQDFRDALMAFVVAAMVMSAIGLFEMVRHWLLYTNLAAAMDIYWSWGNYLERDEAGLRAQGSTGQPIVLGFLIVVAIGFFFFLRKSVTSMTTWRLGLVTLGAGLVAPLSRGPWVGAAAMLIVFIATGPFPAKRLMNGGLALVVVVAALLATPYSETIVGMLPFVGTGGGDSAANVTYRQRLLEIGIGVILQNPFFGAYQFFLSPEAQELKQGNGTIDLVNTYLAVGLSSGLTGLSLFSGVFISVTFGIFKSMRNIGDKNSELYLLGQTLFSVLIGILVIIFTVSSVLAIPVIYWSVAGLGVAYVRLLASEGPPSLTLADARQVGT